MTAVMRELLTEDEGYELFRRAIQDSDADAWAEVYRRYRPILVSWAVRHDASLQVYEDYGDVADQAFERAWRALKPKHFVKFSNLARVLAYLRSCVAAVLIDLSRARSSRDRALQRMLLPDTASPEEMVISQAQREELWRAVWQAAESEQDRIVLVENFIYDVPPRLLLRRYPTLFDDVDDVYAAQRNLKARLQRNLEVRRLWKELRSE